MIRDVAQYRRPGLVSNDDEHGGSFEMCPDKRLGDQSKHEQREQHDQHRELRARRNGLTTQANAVCETA